MRREWVALALLVFSALEGAALAEESPSRGTAPVTSAATPAADDARMKSFNEQSVRPLSQQEVTRLGRKQDLPSRVGPILLISAGGATTFVASMWLLLGIVGPSMCEGTNCSTPDLTGAAVAGAVGIVAVIGGIAWLVDVNHRRHVLERPATGRRMLLPMYDPTTRTAAFTFSQQF